MWRFKSSLGVLLTSKKGQKVSYLALLNGKKRTLKPRFNTFYPSRKTKGPF